MNYFLIAVALILMATVLYRLFRRLQLSLAKHPSIAGHAKMSRAIASRIPRYEYTLDTVFDSDGAPERIAHSRRSAFRELSHHFLSSTSASRELDASLDGAISDMEFTRLYRVPYPYSAIVAEHLPTPTFVESTSAMRVSTVDHECLTDISGSYGVNVFGHEFYKTCIAAGSKAVSELGIALGPYHALTADNAMRLRGISGLDEVSFHMSGTEAVMQAVRLARYHTGRKRIVTFCGSYHGWWDEVQPGVGNPVGSRYLLMLREQAKATLRVLRTRTDIACILVNPIQAMHPNTGAPGDSTLLGKRDSIAYDKDTYSNWLRTLRSICDERGILLIIDDVFLGFRLARGGSQEYFGVQADLVTYGKTLGGGLPVGVVCGRSSLMKRFRHDRPADICFARGTFNSHPLVMACMNEFLRRLDSQECLPFYEEIDDRWDALVAKANKAAESKGLPVRLANMTSIIAVCYTAPSRFNWMLQYYLRREGYLLSWIGTGRFIFPINARDDELEAFVDGFIRAASKMSADGWFWHRLDAKPQFELLKETWRARDGAAANAINAERGP